MMFQASAIVKVAVEPENVQDMPLLLEGLRLLNRADAFVEMEVMDSGEHVLSAAGEVHLERCINDLRERFARVPIRVSKPLVNFKEGITTAGFADYKIGSKKVLRASVERLLVVGDK
jgi:ribosome assembly protein 1